MDLRIHRWLTPFHRALSVQTCLRTVKIDVLDLCCILLPQSPPKKIEEKRAKAKTINIFLKERQNHREKDENRFFGYLVVNMSTGSLLFHFQRVLKLRKDENKIHQFSLVEIMRTNEIGLKRTQIPFPLFSDKNITMDKNKRDR